MNISMGLLIVSLFILSWLITRRLVIFLRKKGMMDVPNARSSHQVATPRGGGLAVFFCLMIGFFVLVLFFPAVPVPGILFFVGLIILAFTSLVDDKYDLPAYLRFFLHGIAAALVIYETGGLERFPLPAPLDFELGFIGYILSFIWIIAVLNIYNFLDGIDGYAGLQAVLAGLGIALFDADGVGLGVGLLVMASTGGFLIHNWSPAKIFMGDIGSISLGFIFAASPFYFTGPSHHYGVFAVIIFLWFFLADGAFTIVKRIFKGEKIWEAHRSHLYQQLVIAGLSHKKVVSSVMAASLLLIGMFVAVWITWPEYLIFILAIAVLFFVIYYWQVEKVKKAKLINH